jgi:hypothetical protein
VSRGRRELVLVEVLDLRATLDVSSWPLSSTLDMFHVGAISVFDSRAAALAA